MHQERHFADVEGPSDGAKEGESDGTEDGDADGVAISSKDRRRPPFFARTLGAKRATRAVIRHFISENYFGRAMKMLLSSSGTKSETEGNENIAVCR